MTIRAATRIAVAGVAIALLASFALEIARVLLVTAPLGTNEANQEIATLNHVWGTIRTVGVTLSEVGILVFLVVLRSTQKDVARS